MNDVGYGGRDERNLLILNKFVAENRDFVDHILEKNGEMSIRYFREISCCAFCFFSMYAEDGTFIKYSQTREDWLNPSEHCTFKDPFKCDDFFKWISELCIVMGAKDRGRFKVRRYRSGWTYIHDWPEGIKWVVDRTH